MWMARWQAATQGGIKSEELRNAAGKYEALVGDIVWGWGLAEVRNAF
jgi:hypothetical protein